MKLSTGDILSYCSRKAKQMEVRAWHGTYGCFLVFSRCCDVGCGLPLLELRMKTQGLEGHSAASWRNQPLTRMALGLLLAGVAAGLWNPRVRIKDFRPSDCEVLRSEGRSRRRRTDLTATSPRNCPKATVRASTPLSRERSVMFQTALMFSAFFSDSYLPEVLMFAEVCPTMVVSV